jgi:hypothetical protein
MLMCGRAGQLSLLLAGDSITEMWLLRCHLESSKLQLFPQFLSPRDTLSYGS